MLVLSRHANERIIIDTGRERIVVTVVETRVDRAKIGVDAPRHVTVHREEIAELIAQQE